jgi:hypothetical protein
MVNGTDAKFFSLVRKQDEHGGELCADCWDIAGPMRKHSFESSGTRRGRQPESDNNSLDNGVRILEGD